MRPVRVDDETRRFAGALIPDSLGGTGLGFTELGLVLASEQLTGAPNEPAPRKWTALQATAASVGFVGLGSDLKVSASNVGVLINQADGEATTVIDYKRSDVSVVTGTNRSLKLSLDGSRGELIRASGTLTLDVYEIGRAHV